MIRELSCGCVVENDRELLRCCVHIRPALRQISRSRALPVADGGRSDVGVFSFWVEYSYDHLGIQKGQRLYVGRSILA